MENKQDYTQPAFPIVTDMPNGQIIQTGMTLLDYFAGQVLSGIAASDGNYVDQDLGSNFRAGKEFDYAASVAYKAAAAMMEERKKYL